MCWPALIPAIGSAFGAIGSAVAGVGSAVGIGGAAAGGAAAAGTAGTAMSGVMTAVQIGSAVVGAGASIYAGQQQANAARAMQNQATQAANDVTARHEEESRAFYRQVAALRGEQIAGASAAGLDAAFGSPLDAQIDTTLLAREDAERMAVNADRERDKYLVSAANYGNEAQAAVTTGYIGAVDSLLGSFSKMASRNGGMTAGPSAATPASYKAPTGYTPISRPYMGVR